MLANLWNLTSKSKASEHQNHLFFIIPLYFIPSLFLQVFMSFTALVHGL